jgi:26S proteasome regulatory subunit N6
MAPPPTNETKLADAKKISKSDPSKAVAIYQSILSKPVAVGSSETALKDYESALLGLGDLYRDHKQAEELAKLIETSRGTLSSFAKAKTAKLGIFRTTSYLVRY